MGSMTMSLSGTDMTMVAPWQASDADQRLLRGPV